MHTAKRFNDRTSKIVQVSGDGGYDNLAAYGCIANRGATPVIPPRYDAVIAQHGNPRPPPLPRDRVVRDIRRLGTKTWKKQTGYHKRSLAEAAVCRIKTIFGSSLRSRVFENQGTEAFLRCLALNKREPELVKGCVG